MLNLTRRVLNIEVRIGMRPALVSQKERITLGIVAGILRRRKNLNAPPIGILSLSRRNPLRDNRTLCILSDVDHFRAGIRLLPVVGNRHRVEFTTRILPLKNATGIFPRDRRTGFDLCPCNAGVLPFASPPLGHKIENTALSILVSSYTIHKHTQPYTYI